MDVDKINEMIKSTVQEILAETAATGIESQVEEALKTAEDIVSAMTERVKELEKVASDGAASLESLESTKVGLETELSACKEELVLVKSEHETLKLEAASVKEELDTVRKDMLIKERLSTLGDLGITRKGEEALGRQVAAVREMTEEEFAAYSQEMVELKAEFVEAVKEEKAVSAEAKVEYTPEDKKEEISTPPADVEEAKKEVAAVLPNSDKNSKDDYKKIKNFGLGLAMLMEEARKKDIVKI
jgi:hypothetical protein